jgi:hypothetical protein
VQGVFISDSCVMNGPLQAGMLQGYLCLCRWKNYEDMGFHSILQGKMEAA